jgi:glycosyltransferase involved in cell wall biosynthesis
MISGITVHMVVKNEDQWIWYSIQSVLQYVDKILITDTGSTDHTVEIIKSIKSPKLIKSEYR